MSDIKNRYKLLVIAQTLEMLSEDGEDSPIKIPEDIRSDMIKVVGLLRSCNKLVNICSDKISNNIDDDFFRSKFELEKSSILKILGEN